MATSWWDGIKGFALDVRDRVVLPQTELQPILLLWLRTVPIGIWSPREHDSDPAAGSL